MKSCENCRYRAIDENAIPCCACIDLGPDLSGWVGLTNADRIRAMSDEELAEWVTTKGRTFGEEYEGYMSLLDWLKSPADKEEQT